MYAVLQGQPDEDGGTHARTAAGRHPLASDEHPWYLQNTAPQLCPAMRLILLQKLDLEQEVFNRHAHTQVSHIGKKRILLVY